ncbi:MAG: universal stress protein [Deltaproteobacteria bacterium]|nr:universal stress protein [Deltaproteobacteria bacterium]
MTERRHLETILVATDFSESAEGAIDWAVEVARPHRAKLLLVHALQPPVPIVASPEAIPLPVEVYEADRKRCEEELIERADRLRSAGTPVETKMVVGAAARSLIEVGEAVHADLIVAGTRGQTGLKRVFLGSTAAYLVRHSTCPVLTVHPEHIRKHRPIHRILVPTDYSHDAERALREAAGILGPVSEHAKVILLHVYRAHPEVVYPWTPPPIVHRSNEMALDARQRLEEVAAPIRQLGFEVELVAQEGHPADVIDEEAKRVDADLIAMGTHGHSGLRRLLFGSVAERVLPAAPCPVLTVHTEETA